MKINLRDINKESWLEFIGFTTNKIGSAFSLKLKE